MAKRESLRKRGGRPREGKELKVVLAASVRAPTAKQLREWVKRARTIEQSVHVGRILDHIVPWANAKGYKFRLP